jgi:hypothetical protein
VCHEAEYLMDDRGTPAGRIERSARGARSSPSRARQT